MRCPCVHNPGGLILTQSGILTYTALVKVPTIESVTAISRTSPESSPDLLPFSNS